MAIHNSALAGLTADLHGLERPLVAHWPRVHETFLRWVAKPEFRVDLRDYVRSLPEAELAARARETTTHFAWCLLDQPDTDFTLWLHEYKPRHDWRPGYADSVHNHRYHFCTTLLHGSYLHERFDATVSAESGLITSVTPRERMTCETGSSAVMLAPEYHRVGGVADDTMTFLVKSRPVAAWSLSYDPGCGVTHRHVPVENRLGEMSARI
ncbi:hypothetical protein [Amycolatopsis pigmentata]|uniref:Cysteine dioxygenase type I n=1 Tax=Amycolatopsis pigmentata TaxID=450801 RepID=A0ABW5FWR8_9PSEU